MSERLYPQDWGEQPPITAEDLVVVVSDMKDRGHPELARTIIEGAENNEEWASEAVRKYMGLMGQ